MIHWHTTVAVLATTWALLAHPGFAEERAREQDWTRFRGPNADGVAQDDPRLPDKWSKTENLKWVADVPGRGWSSPIVCGNKVFLTSVTSDGADTAPKAGLYLGRGVKTPPKGVHHWLVRCLDLKTGQLVWKHEAHKGEPKVPRHPKSNYAAETPTTDGERLYVLFGDVGLYAYDLSGKPLWSHAIEPKRTMMNYGAAASPVVHDGQVLLLYDNMQQSYLASFDAKTGKQLWRTERAEGSTWASPFIWKNSLRTEIVTCGKKKNRAYDLKGKLLWEFDGRMSNLVIPSPFCGRRSAVHHLRLYWGPAEARVCDQAGGRRRHHAEGRREVEWPHRVVSAESRAVQPVSAGLRRRYYTLLDRGFLTCNDAKSGKEIYGRQRLGGSYTASPWAYNGKVFCLDEEGKPRVIQAGSKFEMLRTNDLDELCLSTPAVSQGHLLVRTASKLYCFTKDPQR